MVSSYAQYARLARDLIPIARMAAPYVAKGYRYYMGSGSKPSRYVGSSRARTVRRGGTVAGKTAEVPRGVFTIARGGNELGYIDTTLANQEITTTATITLLNGCAPGTAVNQRIGRRTRIKSIQAHFDVFNKTTSTFTTNRIMLVWDKQPAGSTFAITDLLSQNSGYSFLNPDNANRFIVLKDYQILLEGNSTTPSTGKMQHMVIFNKSCSLDTFFNSGSAGTVADIEGGGLFLVLIGNQATGTAASAATGYLRIRFKQYV